MSDEENAVEVYDQDRIDRLIWRHIGRKPVSAIAKMAGIRPDEVLRRKNELLNSVDVLTVQEKRVKILSELEEIAADAKDRYAKVADEFAAGLLNSSVAAMKTVLVELGRAEKADQGAIERLNEQRVRELLRLIDTTVSAVFEQVETRHGINKDELMDIFQTELVEAAKEFDN